MDSFFNIVSNLLPTGNVVGIFILILSVIGGVVYFFIDWRAERRARDTFGIERRRLTEVNLKVDYDLQFSPVQHGLLSNSQSVFLSMRLPIQNIGDGPVDILAMLVTGRLLSAEEKPGIGARSRDVEWNDFQTLYWNSPRLDTLFVGISTTKNTIAKADDFNRLAAKENGVLRRLDAVENIDALLQREDVLMRHRVFVVARGYPLGEILRQLGGGPPDPSVNVQQGSLQFQTLAEPNYLRWQTVQQALINLNRFVFRIAIYNPADPEESGDPLGFLTEPDAWRIFLLYHWDFVDAASTAPASYQMASSKTQRPSQQSENRPDRKNFTDIIQKLTDRVKQDDLYPDLRLPPGWHTDRDRIKKAREICQRELADFILVWEHMRAVIEACRGYTTSVNSGQRTQKPRVNTREGYPALVFEDPYYSTAVEKIIAAQPTLTDEQKRRILAHPLDFKARWFALMQEGYLISKPFQRRIKFLGVLPLWRRRDYAIDHDIPADPRILEPFVMRSHNLMTSVATPQDGGRGGLRESKIM